MKFRREFAVAIQVLTLLIAAIPLSVQAQTKAQKGRARGDFALC